MKIIETKKPLCGKCGSGQVYTKQKGTILVCRSCGKEEDINFDKTVYFAHQKDAYNTEYESNCINKINELHPGCKIINPRDIKLAEEDKNPKGYAGFMKQMEKYYFSVVKTCNIVSVAKTESGKISPGVQKEIKFALANGIKVEYLDIPFPEDNWPTFPVYYVNETGLGFIENFENNVTEIDIDSAIAFLNEHGIDVEQRFEYNGIDYLSIVDYSQEYGIPGLVIPEVLLDYILKKGYVEKVDTTKSFEVENEKNESK